MRRSFKFIAETSLLVALLAVFGASSPLHAETSTLSLDALSFISFDDTITTPLPPGGSIRFEFGAPKSDGSIPFEIVPSGLRLPSVRILQLNANVQYTLESEARGVLTNTPSGRQITFRAPISVRDLDKPDVGSRTYPISFTTETVSSTSQDGSKVVSREGFRAPRDGRYVQLVGATVARSDNGKGSAVYMVLSGTFDRLP